MIKNYFQSTGTKRKNEEKLEKVSETAPPKAKKNQKRSALYGFTPSTIR